VPWVDDAGAALVTDLYEITMAAGYLESGLGEQPATFELSVRSLPEQRNFLIAAGLDEVLRYFEHLHFDDAALAYLRSLDRFTPRFLDVLGGLRFTGDVRAVPEGTVVFGEEPLLAVTAPMIQAQLVETFVLAALGFQTMIASKAARVALAARGRTVADFGARRAHGADAGLKAARAAFVGGVDSTSLVLAGREFGIPVTGTMAHSYVLAHDSELEAFLSFGRAFPDHTVLLVDTFDTLRGAEIAAEAASVLAGEGITVGGVRLDSGDLASLAAGVRRILDRAGFPDIRILASGGLDEHSIAGLVAAGAPIDGFGVGTRMTTSSDVPSLDVVYKLVEDRSGPRMKTSTGKPTLPGRKQVYRRRAGGSISGDVIALAGETEIEGSPLLVEVMRGGRRIGETETLTAIRDRALSGLDALPPPLRSLDRRADPPYPVGRSRRLSDLMVSLRTDARFPGATEAETGPRIEPPTRLGG
jgi:nicotinate phosphoribosyltransferase